MKKADVVLFSCYIWNVEVCLDVADMLKKVSPETKIIFGGPEVSFDDTEYMQKYDFIDAIMRGEGEATFKEWLEIGEMADGITYRENGEIIRNKDRELIHDITSIPFPYTDEDIEKNSGKLYTTNQAAVVRLGAVIAFRQQRIVCVLGIWTS